MSGSNTTRLAFVGECMVELKEASPGVLRQAFAGDTLNTAVYARRLLAANFELHYVSALGQEHFSKAMLAMWQKEGLQTAWVRQLADKSPGLYYIHVDEQGERSFSYWRSDSAAKYVFSGTEGDILLENLLQFDCIYLSGISLAILPDHDLEKLLEALATFKGKLVFDNNYRPRLWADIQRARSSYLRLLKHCHTALLTWDDEQALFGFTQIEQSKAQCEALGVEEIVFKRGSDACLVFCQGERFDVPAQKVARVVDTTAAGDSFSAGYLSARFCGLAPESAALWGHKLAATVIQHEGGVIAAEHMPELN